MQAPYKSNGDLMHYPERYWEGGRYIDPEWREVVPFQATLIFDGQQRGRSAAYFLWHDLGKSHQYPMFMKDLGNLIKDAVIVKGVVSGIWTVQKRGTNYGIRIVAVNS